MSRLGILSGTVLVKDKRILTRPEDRLVETPYGPGRVLVTKNVALIARHGLDPAHHILPHRINHPANLAALKALGVSSVVGVCSAGSLRPTRFPAGTLAVPEDFICLAAGATIFSDTLSHVTPGLSDAVRARLLAAAKACKIRVADGGVYWQTPGPRLETKAEIRLMASAADLVGMTLAGEAVAACEMDIPYAALCSVDNVANGLGEKPLSLDEIYASAKVNAESVIRILARLIAARD